MSSDKKSVRVHNEWQTNTDDRKRQFNYIDKPEIYRGEQSKIYRGEESKIYRGEEYWKEKLQRLEAELELKEKKKSTRNSS
tara:strand:- start:29 stop:271 length:243 start_codon:yes stop_codon:yes gene_type:complete